MNKNSLWFYFKKVSEKDIAVCTQCTKKIKTAGGSTSGLHSHLKSQHKINLLKRDQEKIVESFNVIDSEPKITCYFKKTIDDSFPALLARMTALDGIPFIKFCKSQDLRMLLIAKGFKEIPKSSKTIKKHVMEYADKVKQEIVKQISQQQVDNKAFSVTLDEWTSIKNCRYMNINVHICDNRFWNLGLCRINGSMPAERCVLLMENKLKEFGISLSNIITITTDGASVMKKAVKLTNANHQLCMAHGLQLAVIKVLYNNNLDKIEDEQTNHVDFPDVSNNENSDSDYDEDDENNDNGLEIIQDIISDYQLISFQSVQIRSLITKIRKVSKLFRKSSQKNDDILQKHVKEEFGKNLSLTIDCKIRWNSLLAMLQRFWLIKDCVRKSLIDLKSDINFTSGELALLSDVIFALQPIKVAVEALCCENVNLYIADIALKFMLDELTSQNTSLSIELVNSLMYRIKERRTCYSDVLQYLSDLDLKYSNEEDYGIFNKTNKITITRLIVELIQRMRTKAEIDTVEITDPISESDKEDYDILAIPSKRDISIKEKLQILIKSKTEISFTKAFTKKTSQSLYQVVKNELNYFREEKFRGKYLQMAYDFLMSIQPTSVESERAFSAAGLVCTKIRSRLNDQTLDKLCFLRTFF